MKRREFLKQAGCFVATVGAVKLGACGEASQGEAGAVWGATFPQGLASGDPRPDSVMLWTRARPRDADAEAVFLQLELSVDRGFEELLVEQMLRVDADSDFTARVLVDGLEPDTVYYYRFVSGDDTSPRGRTWTAPGPQDDTAIHFAWVSCQDYQSGFYGAYTRLRKEEEEGEELRFVLHVGDFIYETRSAGFQTAYDEQLEVVELLDRDGEPRSVPAFPSGGGELAGDSSFAQTLDDYRHLYRTYLADPDLQAARAHWPFVCIWDDHEFTNDAWQTQANYTWADTGDEPSQPRKVAANQAWFEYMPAILSEAQQADGVEPHAHDFRPAEVEVADYDAFSEVDEPNNQAALDTLTVYRRLRFGRHMELVLTDNRSYRSDHAVPEQVTKDEALVFEPRGGLAKDVVNLFDAGREAEGGAPEEIGSYPNLRRDSRPGTVLGARQKRWWKEVMAATGATFKVWGNSIPLLRVLLDSSDVVLIADDLVLAADAWDGYPNERRELMRHLRDNGIHNVISLSGDHHAHLAGVVYDDYDQDGGEPVMLDFAVAGVSSNPNFVSIASAIAAASEGFAEEVVASLSNVIVYDSTELGGSDKAVVNFNTLIRYGSEAANIAAASHDLEQIEAARNTAINPHLRYVDTAANGYGTARLDGEGIELRLVTTERPRGDREEGARVRGEARFVVPKRAPSDPVELPEPTLVGDKPFPLR